MTGGSYTIRGGHWWQRDWLGVLLRVALALAIMGAGLGIAWGAYALSGVTWGGGGGGETFTCDQGQVMIWKQVIRHGNTWTLGDSGNADLVLICKG